MTLAYARRPDLLPDSIAHVTDALTTWTIPQGDGTRVMTIAAKPGSVTTIVGPNGSGKSALASRLHQLTVGTSVRRVIAHRKLWFHSSGTDISATHRQQQNASMENWARQDDSRYLDHADGSRPGIVLFDLIAKIHSQNASIVDKLQGGASPVSILNTVGERVLDQFNKILEFGGLPVELMITDGYLFNARNRQSGAQYPIHYMSDGEKSAFLLVAELLSAPWQCVLIVDEPERHLHRSISAGLIEAVIRERQDCHFAILTHDLELAGGLHDLPGRTLSVLGCRWEQNRIVGWDLFEIDPSNALPPIVRAAILGGRTKILFVEGTRESLDLRLYSLLFPGWTLVPQGGCDEVIRSVSGLNHSSEHHWVEARGIVDRDGRSAEEIDALAKQGVLAIGVCEIESIYYSSDILEALARKQAANLDLPADELLGDAKERALAVLNTQETLSRLVSDIALKIIRREILSHLPASIDAQTDTFLPELESPFARLLCEATSLLVNKDIDRLIKLLPIKDTPIRAQISVALHYRSQGDLEANARVLIRDDSELRERVRILIGSLPV